MTSRRVFVPTLYAIADASALSPSSAPDLVKRAIRGGVTAVQVRAKNLDDGAFLDFARIIAAAAGECGVAVLINDRVDIALALGAAGVHLGAGDLPPNEARRVLGAAALVGVTAHTSDEIRAAAKFDVDYLGFGSIYPSPSKAVETVQGPEGVREARKLTELPLVAIGGITVERAAEVIAAGADGVAVISGLWSADDVEARARAYREAIEQGRRRR